VLTRKELTSEEAAVKIFLTDVPDVNAVSSDARSMVLQAEKFLSSSSLSGFLPLPATQYYYPLESVSTTFDRMLPDIMTLPTPTR